jgi:hypothetical protein
MLKSSHMIGNTPDFMKLVHRPVALPNWFRRCCRFDTSVTMDHRDMTESSANRLVLIFTGVAPIGDRRLAWVALSSIFCSESIVSMKSIGEYGLSCQSPFTCLIGLTDYLSLRQKFK